MSHDTTGHGVSPHNNYTVRSGEVTCVVMTAAIHLTIPYVGQNGNLISTISVPSDAVSSGQCQPNLGQDTLDLTFNSGWQLSIIFSNASGTAFQWQRVSLTYKTDAQHFPNISTTSENLSNTQVTVFPAITMVTNLGSSFLYSEKILHLNGSVTMNISSLQYRALGTDKSTWFKTTGVKLCSTPDAVIKTDIALAVSLGIALGVAIVGAVLLFPSLARSWRNAAMTVDDKVQDQASYGGSSLDLDQTQNFNIYPCQ